MRLSKKLALGLLSLLMVLPATVIPAAAASAYSNDFSVASMSDFDTTTANALIKDGTLQLKAGDGDMAVILKTEKYENFTMEVDVTVTNANDGGAPFLLYHTQEFNNPFQGGTYTAVIYPTDVKGCFFAPYHDNGWIRELNIYKGDNETFHIKLEVYNNYATFYANDVLVGSYGSGTEHTNGYVGLGSYKAAVTYDNLKVTPDAPQPKAAMGRGEEILSDEFASDLSNYWVSKTPEQISVADGKLSVAAPDKNDRYALYSNSLTAQKYIVETTFNPANGNSGLLVKGAFNGSDYEGYSFTYDKESGLMKASRYFSGYLSMVENIRIAPLSSGDHTLSVDVDGSRHAMYVDGILILEFIDDTFHDGSVGYISYDGTASFDNLKVYQEGSTAAPTSSVGSTPAEPESSGEEISAVSSSAGAGVSSAASNVSSAADTSSEAEGLPGYAVPLIILGVLIVLGAGGAVAFFVIKKKKGAQEKEDE